ncbi:MAG: response regulator [Candidatus Hydrogenedentes bacterium]|nr:response regulator [Candidatus Hydrogenedentota bacterium]
MSDESPRLSAHLEQAYTEALTLSHSGIILCTFDGVILETSGDVAPILGLDGPDASRRLVGTRITELVIPLLTEDSILDTVREQGAFPATERFFHTLSGELKCVRLDARRIADPASGAECVQIVAHDISDLKSVEVELRRRTELQELVTRISTEFINVRPDSLRESMARALADIGAFLTVDVASAILLTPDRKSIQDVLEWNVGEFPTIKEVLQGRQAMEYPWILERLERGEAVFIAGSDGLPPAAEREQNVLRELGIRSLMAMPLIAGQSYMGLVVVVLFDEERVWSADEVALLRLASEIFSGAIERKRAEEELHKRIGFERIINTISAQFINVDPSEIGAEIDQALRLLGEFVNADRCYMSMFSDQEDVVVGGYEWCAPGVQSQYDILHGKNVRTTLVWAERQFYQHNCLIISSLSELPPEAAAERALFEAQSIKSLLNVPITVGRKLIGLLGFETVYDERVWTEDTLAMASLMGQALGNAVVRKRAEEERRSLEEQIWHAQKLESLGVLAGGIAHDFNNLLMAILGNASLARLHVSGDSPALECIEHIEKASQHAAELTNQMLAYAGKGALSIGLVSMSKLASEMISLLETSVSKKARIDLNLDPDTPLIKGDTGQLRQVVMNLVTNASDAVGDSGGTIHLSTGMVYVDESMLSEMVMAEGFQCGECVFLEVNDTGCGMDEETKRRVFDPFFSTKFTGRGLGLAAVLGIVRGHHGAIHLESSPGKGTTFLVYFPPAGATEVSHSEEREAASSEWQAWGGILVVDDEEEVRRVAQALLERRGFQVFMASDGVEALEVYREHASEIRAVLLDMTMPNMGGRETYEALSKLNPNLPVAFSSGYMELEELEPFHEQENVAFIQKPYSIQALHETIARLLGM